MNVKVDLSDPNPRASAAAANSRLETSVFDGDKSGADALIRKIINENVGS
jgi:hypothetical protein